MHQITPLIAQVRAAGGGRRAAGGLKPLEATPHAGHTRLADRGRAC
ncbi:hypothetical protein [Streptomyces sp. BBFR102]